MLPPPGVAAGDDAIYGVGALIALRVARSVSFRYLGLFPTIQLRAVLDYIEAKMAPSEEAADRRRTYLICGELEFELADARDDMPGSWGSEADVEVELGLDNGSSVWGRGRGRIWVPSSIITDMEDNRCGTCRDTTGKGA